MNTFKLITGLLLLSLWQAPMAAEDLDPESSSSKPRTSRQESLELPGLTACHQCEWRPSAHNMAAAERCGLDDQGKANIALFECGFSQDCQRVCNFVRCANEAN